MHDSIENQTTLFLAESWPSQDSPCFSFALANQIIEEIDASSNFTLQDRLVEVLDVLDQPKPTNISNFVRKIRNKVSRASRVGSHILGEPVFGKNDKPDFVIGPYCDDSGIVEKQLADHLPGGKFFNPTQELRTEMTTTPLDNLCAERLFASLDRLQKRMPNANTLSMEGIILWTQNKTRTYLENLPNEEKSLLMEQARQRAPAILQGYRARKEQIKVHYRNMQVQQEKDKNRRLLRAAEIRDDIVEAVMAEGGPCKTEKDLSDRMSKLDPSQHRGFLLNQIKYYKSVHQFPGLDKSLFCQQSKGKKLSVQSLHDNLLNIIRHRDNLP